MEQTLASRLKPGDTIRVNGALWTVIRSPLGSGIRNAQGRIVSEEITLTIVRPTEPNTRECVR